MSRIGFRAHYNQIITNHQRISHAVHMLYILRHAMCIYRFHILWRLVREWLQSVRVKLKVQLPWCQAYQPRLHAEKHGSCAWYSQNRSFQFMSYHFHKCTSSARMWAKMVKHYRCTYIFSFIWSMNCPFAPPHDLKSWCAMIPQGWSQGSLGGSVPPTAGNTGSHGQATGFTALGCNPKSAPVPMPALGHPMPMAMAQPMLAALQQILSGNLLPPAPNGGVTAPPPAPAAPPPAPAPAPGVLQAAPVLSNKVQPPPLLGGNGKMFFVMFDAWIKTTHSREILDIIWCDEIDLFFFG